MDIADVILDMLNDPSNLQLPDPYLRNYYLDEQNRTYCIDTEITDRVLDLVRMIIRWNEEDEALNLQSENRIPIKILISSPGGNVMPAWTLINAIQTSKTKVITVNYCYAYSAAALILAAGHERYALRGTSCMLHNGGYELKGQVDQVESAKKFLDKINKRMDQWIFDRSSINSRGYKRKAIVDWYLDEDEMLSNGIVDHIVNSFDELPRFGVHYNND